jgi:hypothetical protein
LYFILEGEFQVCKSITYIRDENEACIDFKGTPNELYLIGLTIPDKMKSELGSDYYDLKALEMKSKEQKIDVQTHLSTKYSRVYG